MYSGMNKKEFNGLKVDRYYKNSDLLFNFEEVTKLSKLTGLSYSRIINVVHSIYSKQWNKKTNEDFYTLAMYIYKIRN